VRLLPVCAYVPRGARRLLPWQYDWATKVPNDDIISFSATTVHKACHLAE